PKLIVDAERRGMPIYVLRANTVSQMENFLIDVFKLEVNALDPFGEALRETEQAISRILAGADYIDLSPADSNIRRRQHELARRADLASRSYGEEPVRHVRIYRQQPA
ncbi:MAG: R3H domain-containing nucleic acid-binding protein, partial [bacterium]|nr:R3H domain-containing nucleic acid-binding protein [bacterium]